MKDRITVVGNVANVPENRTIPSGVPVVNFRLATNQGHFDAQTGKWVEREPNWYTVSAYRGLAEHALESLHRGERVIVTGTLRLRKWESGEKKGTEAEIDAEALGHDLRWGTTQFRRDTSSRAGAGDTEPSAAGEGDDTAPGRSQWATAPLGDAGTGESSLVDASAGAPAEAPVPY